MRTAVQYWSQFGEEYPGEKIYSIQWLRVWTFQLGIGKTVFFPSCILHTYVLYVYRVWEYYTYYKSLCQFTYFCITTYLQHRLACNTLDEMILISTKFFIWYVCMYKTWFYSRESVKSSGWNSAQLTVVCTVRRSYDAHEVIGNNSFSLLNSVTEDIYKTWSA